MSKLKIYPCGGVGEIGSNMTVFETENNIVVIDYGILFPYDDFFNINYLIVDLEQIDKDKKITLFVTHGHEDHIGAIPHFVKRFPEAEIYAPQFSATLIKLKLERRKLNKKIHIYQESDFFEFDEYTLHPVHVTHSIPQTHGVIFHSPDFSTLFISDFKYDENPSFENPFNIDKVLNLLSTSKKTMAMIDSTNILSPGKTKSESELIPALKDIINDEKRTFITLFSSNIYRLKNILELAKEANKTVIPIGRSIHQYLAAAHESNLLCLDDYKIKEIDSVDNPESSNNLFLVTGSQGEFLGAAKRIIQGEQKHIVLTENDQFVFSSKPIPGNEKKIYRLYNQLSEQDVTIRNYQTDLIHASGHPCQEDIKKLFTKFTPDFFIPIHGESYFLKCHQEFFKHNWPLSKVIRLKNFTGVEVDAGNVKEFQLKEVAPHLIHGNDHIIEREKISERRKIADNGIVFISLNHKTENISVQSKGLPLLADDHLLKVKDLVSYIAFVENKKRDHDYTIEQVRIKIRTFYNSILGYKPITLVQMV